MNNEIIYKEISYAGRVIHRLTYANGETAFVRDNRITSSPEDSTAIYWWMYDVDTKELWVRYQNSTTYYVYAGVPFFTVFAMLSADSLGAFVAKEIKPNFGMSSYGL